MLKTVGVMALATLTLGGCAVFGGRADQALRRSPSFRAGYSDGCSAATGQTANPRDTKDSLAGEDKIYRRGYATGLQSCRTSNPTSNPFSNGMDNNTPKNGRP